jgi:heat shock protein HslJ
LQYRKRHLYQAGHHLTLELEAITRAICGPDSLSDDYIAYLGDVASYVIENGKLYLNLKADAGNMLFRVSGNG